MDSMAEPRKAPSGISRSEKPRSMDLRLSVPLKAIGPIDSKALGIDTEYSLLQSEKNLEGISFMNEGKEKVFIPEEENTPSPNSRYVEVKLQDSRLDVPEKA